MRRRGFVKALFFRVVVLFITLQGVPAAFAAPVKVVTSIRPLALIVTDIAPAAVEVEYLVPVWSDPHSFQLKASDVQHLLDASIVVWLGEDFERFLVKVLPKANKAQILTLSELDHLQWPHNLGKHHDDDDHHDDRDPHLWLDPNNALVIGGAVASALSAQLPAQKLEIEQNLNRWRAQVLAQTSDIQQRLKPYQHLGFGVSHDGYNHFVGAFGLRQLAAVAVLPSERLSAKKLAALQMQLASARCLIVEADVPQAQRLANTLKLPLMVADPLAANKNTQTYVALIASLADVFIRCLSS